MVLTNSGAGLDKPEKGMLGYTPLIAAALSDGTNVFNFLLISGANPNARSRSGETPLMAAASKGDMNRVKVIRLIRAGADVNARDAEGVSVLRHAEAAAASDVVRILKEQGARN
jgi:ankyrin repeat protein